MAREAKTPSPPNKATLQNACFWLAMRPEGTDIDLAVTMTALLFVKTEHDIRKRISVIKQMAA